MRLTKASNLNRGLVGAWCPSVSGSGLLLPDLSGYGNHGTLTNMDASDWVGTDKGRALDFDGVDDFVNLDAYATKFSSLSVGTLSIWFKLRSQTVCDLFSATESSLTNDRCFLSVGNVTGFYADDSMSIALISNSSIVYFGVVRNGDGFYFDNKWHHACWIGSNSGNSLFVDQVQQTLFYPLAGNASTAGFFNILNANSCRIGARNLTGFASNNTNGQLNDIRIYNRVLSPSEIKQLYEGGPGYGLRLERKRTRFASQAFNAGRYRTQQLIGSGVY